MQQKLNGKVSDNEIYRKNLDKNPKILNIFQKS